VRAVKAATNPQVLTLVADSKQRSSLMAGDDDEMFITGSLHVMPKTTEQHFIARTPRCDKSLACVNRPNNKKTLLDVLYY